MRIIEWLRWHLIEKRRPFTMAEVADLDARAVAEEEFEHDHRRPPDYGDGGDVSEMDSRFTTNRAQLESGIAHAFGGEGEPGVKLHPGGGFSYRPDPDDQKGDEPAREEAS